MTLWISRFKALSLIEKCLLLGFFVYGTNFIFLGWLIGPYDFDHLSSYYEVAYRFWITSKSLLPHFNPFLGGGRSLGADPQVPIFHPLIILVPLIGPTMLIKLEMLLQLLGGVYGLRGMVRFFGGGRKEELLSAFLFVSGGGVVCRFMVGHVTLGFYFLLPLFFYASYCLSELKVVERRKFLPFYYGLFIYCGLYKPNFLIYLVPVLFLEHIMRAYILRKWSVLFHFLMGVLFCGFVNAVSYLPANQYFSQFLRVDPHALKWTSPILLFLNLLLPAKTIPKTFYWGGMNFFSFEYNYFMGPIALMWAGFGMMNLKRLKRECYSLVFFMVISILLGCGSGGESGWQVFDLFYKVWPGFHSVRVSVRFWFGVYLGLIVFASIGSSYRQKNGQLIFWGHFIPLIIFSTINLSRTSFLSVESQWGKREFREFAWVNNLPENTHRYIQNGWGVLHGVHNMTTFETPYLRGGRLLLSESKNVTNLKATWIDWHRFKLEGEGRAGSFVQFNLNNHPYWIWKGTGVEKLNDLTKPLSIVIKERRFEGEFSFVEPRVFIGAFISLVSLFSFIGFSLTCFFVGRYSK